MHYQDALTTSLSLWADLPVWLEEVSLQAFDPLAASTPYYSDTHMSYPMISYYDTQAEQQPQQQQQIPDEALTVVSCYQDPIMASVAPPQSQPPAMTLDSVMAPMARPLASSQSTPLLASYDPPPSQAPRERKRTKSMPSFILMADEERMPRPQKPRYKDDMYSPRWVRYSGHLKEGYCETCPEGRWLQLKNSAYWYHKQFYHGISSVTGKRFAEALQQRIGPDGILQGLCHQCGRFVPICNGKKRRNHLLWYKHAHKCHIYIKPEKFSHPV